MPRGWWYNRLVPAPELGQQPPRSAPDVAAPVGKPIAVDVHRATTRRVAPVVAARGADARRLRPAQVLALQRSVGNGAVTRLLGATQGPRVAQRAVRIDGGKKRVDEAYYTTGKGKAIGSKRSVASLIGDGVRRVFVSAAELERYANGQTDYIGDVVTTSAGTFWYRLPKDKLTVLGEEHDSPDGNVEDVIIGLGTSRFMYEPFNELAAVTALNIAFTGTQTRLDQVNRGLRVAGLVDRTKFDPDLENIIVKALTGASITRNEYIAAAPAARATATWKKRASRNDYSLGERAALYLSMAIHIASDVAQYNFGTPNFVESLFVASGRGLKDTYVRHKAVLDAFMKAKDRDDLIGIYELTEPGGYANLAAIKEFTVAFHEYGSRYIARLGTESASRQLETQGDALAANPGAKLDAFSPVREAIMWQKIAAAKNYLIVGMGDAHRVNLKAKLDAAGIPHEKADEALVRQKKAVDAGWVP